MKFVLSSLGLIIICTYLSSVAYTQQKKTYKQIESHKKHTNKNMRDRSSVLMVDKGVPEENPLLPSSGGLRRPTPEHKGTTPPATSPLSPTLRTPSL